MKCFFCLVMFLGMIPASAGRAQIIQPNVDQTRISGEVIEAREEIFKKGSAPSRVVVLRTTASDVGAESGENRRLTVDLGPAKKISGINFRVGSEITVQGRVVTMLGRTMLVASKVELNGKTIPIER